jgi:hypothetical protein
VSPRARPSPSQCSRPWLCPRFRQNLATEIGGGAVSRPATRLVLADWILSVHPRSGGLGLIRSEVIPTVHSGFERPDPRHRPCSAARPDSQSCLRSLTPPGLPVSARRAFARARPWDLISVIRLRSCGRDGSIPLRV